MTAAQAELAQWQSKAADEADPADEAEPVDERPTGIPPAVEAAPGTPTWSLAAQRTFSAGLASITDWRGVLKQAVKLVGVEGNWDAVVVWSPEQRRTYMKCAAMWSGDALSATTFETRVWQHRQKLPADSGTSGYDVVAPLDGAADALLKSAAAEGMNSSVLVPISDGAHLLGMLQLFSSHGEAPGSELVVSLEGIGLQLAITGRLLESAGTPHWRLGRL